MTVERAIQLDVSVPDFRSGVGAGMGHAGGGALKQEPDAQARDRFAAALRAPPEPGTSAPGAALAAVPQPFALFGGGLPTRAPQTLANTMDLRLADDLVQALAVRGEGQGGAQVRIELKDDALPGVSVSVQEADGRLQVDFVCMIEAPRLRLAQAVEQHAATLAQRLAREVLVRVQTDDPEDPCLVQALAHP